MGSGRGMNILLGKICFSQLLSYLKRLSCLVLSPKMYKVELRKCVKRRKTADRKKGEGKRAKPDEPDEEQYAYLL
jgi:hypothetical protein